MDDNRRNGKTVRNLILSVILCAFALTTAIPATYAFFCESFESADTSVTAGTFSSCSSVPPQETPTKPNEEKGTKKLLAMVKDKQTLSVEQCENGYVFTSPKAATEVITTTLTITSVGTVDGYTLVTVSQGDTEKQYVVVTDSETKTFSVTLSFYPNGGTVTVTSEGHWGTAPSDVDRMPAELTFGTKDSLKTIEESPLPTETENTDETPPTEETSDTPEENVPTEDETPSKTTDETTETENPMTENNDDNTVQQ